MAAYLCFSSLAAHPASGSPLSLWHMINILLTLTFRAKMALSVPNFPNRAEVFCLLYSDSFLFSYPFFLPVQSRAALWLQWFCHLKPMDLHCGSALVLWHTLASILLHVYRSYLLQPCCVESTPRQVTSQECGKSSSCVFPDKCIRTCRLLLLSYQAKRCLH